MWGAVRRGWGAESWRRLGGTDALSPARGAGPQRGGPAGSRARGARGSSRGKGAESRAAPTQSVGAAACSCACGQLRTSLWCLFPLWILGIRYKFRVKCDTRREVKGLTNYLESQQRIEQHAGLRGPSECSGTLWFVVMDCFSKVERFWCSCRKGSWVQRRMKYRACHMELRNKDAEGLQVGSGFWLSVCCFGRKWWAVQLGRVRRLHGCGVEECLSGVRGEVGAPDTSRPLILSLAAPSCPFHSMGSGDAVQEGGLVEFLWVDLDS